MKIFSVNKISSTAGRRLMLWVSISVMIAVVSYLVVPFVFNNLVEHFGEKFILITFHSAGFAVNLATALFLLIRSKYYLRVSLWTLLVAPSILLASANMVELYLVVIAQDQLSASHFLILSEFAVSLSLMTGIILTAPIFASMSSSQEQLRMGELKFRSIFETSSDAVLLVDNRTFLILDCNQKGCDSFGYSRDEMIGKKAIELSAEQTNTEHSFKNNIDTVSLRYYKRKDGTIFPAAISGGIYEDGDHEVRVGFIRDLTEQQKQEELFHNSEERFRIALDALNGYLYENNLETNKAYRSHNFAHLIGYSENEVPNDMTTGSEFIHPDDRERVAKQRMEDLESARTSFEREYRILKKNGKYIIVNDRGHIIRNDEGRAVKFYGSVVDITDRRDAEKRIQESEIFLNGILESTNDGILAVDNNGKVIKANNRFAQLWKIPVAMVKGSDDSALLKHVQDQVMNPEAFLAGIQVLYNSDRSEFDNVRLTDGKVFERHSTSLKLNNDIVGRVWSFRDVTVNIHAEQKLRDNERLLKESQEISRIGSYILDIKAGIWNGSVVLNDLFGLCDEDDHSIDGWESVIHPEQREEMSNYFSLDVVGARKRFDKEYRIIRKNTGEMRWVHGIGELEYDESGAPVKMIGTIQDITERKKAEQIVQSSEQRFRFVWENTQDAMRLADEHGRMIMVNKAFCDIVEKRKEEVEGFSMESVYSSKDPEMLENYRKYFINRKSESLFESDMELWNGKTIPVEISHTFLFIPEQPPMLLSVFHDITSRKQAQQELSRERTLLRTVIDNIPDPIYLKDTQGRKILANIADAQFAGRQTVNEVLGKTDAELYPEHIASQSLLEDETVIRTGISMKNYEGNFFLSNGERRWLIGNKILINDDNGAHFGILGINHDITERKLVEEKNLMLAHTVESISEAVTVTDFENRLIYVNKAFLELFEYSKDEVIGKNVRILWSNNNPQDLETELMEQSRTSGWKGDLLNVTKSGKEISVHLSTSQVRNDRGDIVALVGVSEDISERKKALDTIRANEQFVKDILNSLAENIAVLDESGTIVNVNKAWIDFGVGNNNVHSAKSVGMNYLDVCRRAVLSAHDAVAQQVLNGLTAVIKKELPFFTMEYSCSSELERRWFMMRVFPMSAERKGVVVSHEDISEQKRSQELLLARLKISEIAKKNTMLELLQKILDEAELLTDSSIGFFHFVHSDQENLSLQAWSTNTRAAMCTAEGTGLHHSIANAGVWAECIQTRRPVIHNEYATMPNRKELPEGHARLVREIVVPVIRNDRVEAVVGIGNKRTPYGIGDMKILEQFANLAWDIVLRKQAEDAYTESEQRWKYALEGAGDAVWEWDVVSNKVFRSPRWKEMLGYAADEISDEFSEIDRLVHPDDNPLIRESLQHYLNGATDSFAAEYRLRCKNGDYKWVLDRGKTMQHQENNRPVRVIGTHTDISALKKVQSEFRELNEHLEEKVQERTRQLIETNKQLETFSYSVSHDLRAPLRAIDSFSRILFEEELERISDNGKRQISLIRANTLRMSRLIDDLLEFSRTNRSELKKMPFDMSILIRKVINEFIAAEPERKIDTRIGTLPKVIGDPSLFRQVFVNLIGNALKFSKHRDISVIEIGGSESELETTYFIRDNGAGFDMQYVNKLFGVFQRLHSEKEYEGTGVGLAIVQRIIQRHGGTIQAAGELDNGATFTFTIPKQVTG